MSGGLDSSALVAWMRHHAPGRIKTFTAVFNERSYDESVAARRTAQWLGTEHHEAPVESNALGFLPKLVWHSEELTADASMLALYCLAESARRHVKVVISGDGADELFGGYATYLASRAAVVYARLPQPLRHWRQPEAPQRQLRVARLCCRGRRNPLSSACKWCAPSAAAHSAQRFARRCRVAGECKGCRGFPPYRAAETCRAYRACKG